MKTLKNPKNNNLKFTKLNNTYINENSEVKVKVSQKKIIIKNSFKTTNNLRAYCRKSGNKYWDYETNELKTYKNKVYKNEEAIKDSMRRLKDLITLNFNGSDSAYFITLTCKENVTNIKQIRTYLRNFLRRLKYHFRTRYEFLYIYKLEQQQRGSWHVHLLIRDVNDKKIFLNYRTISEIWDKGMVYLRTFNDNSISFYENDELEEDDNEEDDSEDIKVNENKQKSLLKKITNYTIKSNQLFKIRSNENLYGSSRNVERPKTVTMRKYEADNVVASDNAIFDESTAILVEDINTNKIVNVYNTIVFTRKKHKDKNE